MIEIQDLIEGSVYRLKIPMSMEPGYVYAYIVRRDDACVMIDAGYPSNEVLNLLINTIRGIPNCRLGTLIITHAHIDHYGLAKRLRDNLGVRLVIHANDHKQLLKIRDTERFVSEVRELAREWGVPGSEEAVLVRVAEGFSRRAASLGDLIFDELLTGDEAVINGLRVVLTPGHSPGHVSIIHSDYKIAFTGDLVLPTITTHVGLSPINPGNPLLAYIKSLFVIRGMGLRCLYPRHEHEVCNIDERVGELINHRVSRLCDVVRALDDGSGTVFEVTNRLRWMDNRQYSSLDPVNKYLALTETAALIRYLEGLGIIVADSNGRYRVTGHTKCDIGSLIPIQ
jgi:glyoxylase-like metal-dependent hydrolase (beta-lactamase superfamily II)